MLAGVGIESRSATPRAEKKNPRCLYNARRMNPENFSERYLSSPKPTGGPGDFQSRPRVAMDPSGRAWLLFLARDEGKPARLLLSRLEPDGVESVEEVPHGLERVHDVALAVAPDSTLHVLACGLAPEGWAVRAIACRPQGGFGRSVPVEESPCRALHPAAIVDAEGRAIFAYEILGGARAGVWVRREGAEGFGPPIPIASAGSHRPSLAAAPDGSVWVAFENVSGGRFRVGLARLEGNRVAEALPDPLPEEIDHCRPRAAADGTGVWVAFERWSERTANMRVFDGPEKAVRHSLFGARKVALVRIEGGQVRPTLPNFPARRPGSDDPSAREALIHLGLDSAGSPWVFWRELGSVYGLGDFKNFGLVARGIEGGRWTSRFEMTRGRLGPSAEAAVAREPGGGFLAVWAADERNFDEHVRYETLDGPQRLAWARLAGGIPSVLTPVRESAPPAAPALVRHRWRRREPGAVEISGRPYRVAFGDLHRHTEISVCLRAADANVEDHYRYVRDALGLDFVAITDHHHHLSEEEWDLLSRLAALHDVPGEFVAFPAAEMNAFLPDNPMRKMSDNNIFFLEDFLPWRDFRGLKAHAYPALLDYARRQKALLIPHVGHENNLYISGEQWAGFDGETQSVVEIVQTRGSYEFEGAPHSPRLLAELALPATYARDALKAGRRFGFVGAGDHSGRDITGVLATELSRRGIAEAIRARRTFATTGAQMVLDLRVNGAPMGSVLRLPAGLPLRVTASIRALAAVREALLVVNGEEVHRWENLPPQADLSLDWDLSADRDASVYLRVTQEDFERGWASPVFVERIPR